MSLHQVLQGNWQVAITTLSFYKNWMRFADTERKPHGAYITPPAVVFKWNNSTVIAQSKLCMLYPYLRFGTCPWEVEFLFAAVKGIRKTTADCPGPSFCAKNSFPLWTGICHHKEGESQQGNHVLFRTGVPSVWSTRKHIERWMWGSWCGCKWNHDRPCNHGSDLRFMSWVRHWRETCSNVVFTRNRWLVIALFLFALYEQLKFFDGSRTDNTHFMGRQKISKEAQKVSVQCRGRERN